MAALHRMPHTELKATVSQTRDPAYSAFDFQLGQFRRNVQLVDRILDVRLLRMQPAYVSRLRQHAFCQLKN